VVAPRRQRDLAAGWNFRPSLTGRMVMTPSFTAIWCTSALPEMSEEIDSRRSGVLPVLVMVK
jgi:hypothetical protein